MYDIVSKCSQLELLDISTWDTSSLINMNRPFMNCNKLQELDFSNWDISNVTSIDSIFIGCSSLKSLIGGRTIENVLENNISCLKNLKISIQLTPTVLDRASLRALINGLADLTGQTAQTLTIGETLIAKLTEEDIAIATAKNWTIA
jgi:surface protein